MIRFALGFTLALYVGHLTLTSIDKAWHDGMEALQLRMIIHGH